MLTRLFSFFFISIFLIIKNNFLLADNNAKQKLEQQLNQIKSIQAEFEQTVQNNEGKTTKEYGNFIIKFPNDFIWGIKKPYRQDTIVNAKKILIIDYDLQQVTIQDHNLHNINNSNENILPIDLLTGKAKKFLQNYNVSYQINKQLEEYCILPIIQDNNIFTKINIIFKDHIINKIKLSDTFDNTRTISLIKMHENKPIDQKLFTINIPKNFDIIDNSQTKNPKK